MAQETDFDYGVDVISGGVAVYFPCKDRADQGRTILSMVKNAVGEGGVLVADDETDAWVYEFPGKQIERRTIRPSTKPKVR